MYVVLDCSRSTYIYALHCAHTHSLVAVAPGPQAFAALHFTLRDRQLSRRQKVEAFINDYASDDTRQGRNSSYDMEEHGQTAGRADTAAAAMLSPVICR